MSSADHVDGSIRSILVATDGSDAATDALERGVELAERMDAVVHILSVVDATANPMQFGVADVAELHEARERLVEEVVAAVDDRDVELQGAIRRGRPADAILTYAEENGIDLLVVGRTGRGRVAQALLGSTTDRLLRDSSLPVIVVPADDHADDNNGEQREQRN